MADANLVSEVEMKTVRFSGWLILAQSLVWRSLIAVIGSMLIGGILGFILGFVGSMLGLDIETMRPFITLIGSLKGFV